MDADSVALVELENEFSDTNGDGRFAISTLIDAHNERVGTGTYDAVSGESLIRGTSSL